MLCRITSIKMSFPFVCAFIIVSMPIHQLCPPIILTRIDLCDSDHMLVKLFKKANILAAEKPWVGKQCVVSHTVCGDGNQEDPLQKPGQIYHIVWLF